MGNKQYVQLQEKFNEKCQINIEISNTEIITGKNLYGSVHLTVNEPIQYKYLELELIGEELTVGYEPGYLNPYSKHLYKLMSQYFYLFEDKNEPISAGYYIYKFEIQLPVYIPQSIKCIYDDNNYGMNFYHLTARLVNNKYDSSEIFQQIPIQIQQSPNTLLKISETKQNIKNIKTCYKFRHGKSKLSVKIQKQNYFPGEPIMMEVDIDNQDSSIKCVLEAEIYQNLKIKTNYDHRRILLVKKTTLNDSVGVGNQIKSKYSIDIPEVVSQFPSHLGFNLQNSFYLQISLKPDTKQFTCYSCGDYPSIQKEIHIFKQIQFSKSKKINVANDVEVNEFDEQQFSFQTQNHHQEVFDRYFEFWNYQNYKNKYLKLMCKSIEELNQLEEQEKQMQQ